jgi:hypothetical protein
MGVVGQRHAPVAVTGQRDPVQEARWAPGPVWTGVENLSPTRIRTSDHPALSEVLSRSPLATSTEA